MSKTMVERLAEKWDDAFAGQLYPDADPERHEFAKSDVRWFLRAIADEIEGRQESDEGRVWVNWYIAHEIPRLLRDQADLQGET